MSAVLYLLFWAGLFFVMMRFGCGAHIAGHGHHGRHGDGNNAGGRRSEPAMATDPVCGMSVATPGAKSSLYRGKAFYFCSAKCRDTFEEAPERWSGDVRPPPAAHHPANHGDHHGQ